MKNNKIKISLLVLLIVAIGVGVNIYIKKKSSKTNELPSYVKTTVVNKEFFDSMNEKQLIVYKMMNSIDFYKNAQGEVIQKTKMTNEEDKMYFKVDLANKKTYFKMGNEVYIVKDNKKYQFNEDKKEYRIINEGEPLKSEYDEETIKKLKPEDRLIKGTLNIITREEPVTVFIAEVLIPDTIATRLLDYSKWDIVCEKEYLGRKCIEIKGNYGRTGSQGDATFELLVDKDTGIVLKNISLNKKGQDVQSTVVTKIKIDKGINQDSFNKSVDNYKKMKINLD